MTGPRGFPPVPIEEFELALERLPTGCWRWPGPADVRVKTAHGRVRLVRALWEKDKEPLPAGSLLRRLCRTEGCVSPAHQELHLKRTRTVCSIADCARPVLGRGWCGTHYARWRAYGSTDLPESRGDVLAYFDGLTPNGTQIPFHSIQQLSQATQIKAVRLTGISTGHARPRWRDLLALSHILHRDTHDLALQLWETAVGAPCPCGCSGTLVPVADCACGGDHEPLTRLPTVQPCEDCGATRFHHRNTPHYEYCRACKYGDRRTQEFRCVGYDFFGESRFADKCPGTRRLAPSYIRKTREQGERVRGTPMGKATFRVENYDRSFIDKRTLTYRCGPCALGSISVVAKKERARAVTAERIRSPGQLSEAMSILGHGYHDQHPEIANNMQRAGVGATIGPEGREAFSRARIRDAWSGTCLEDLPTVSVHRCEACSLLLIYATRVGPVRRHMRCPRKDAPESRLTPSPRRRGPPELRDLKRELAWAIQHRVGGRSLREIAQNWNVTAPAVRKGIDRLVDALPPEELVHAGYRQHLQLIRPVPIGSK